LFRKCWTPARIYDDSDAAGRGTALMMRPQGAVRRVQMLMHEEPIHSLKDKAWKKKSAAGPYQSSLRWRERLTTPKAGSLRGPGQIFRQRRNVFGSGPSIQVGHSGVV